MDLELLIDKIDFSQGARQIAKQALELGMKCQKDSAWHPVENYLSTTDALSVLPRFASVSSI